MRWLDFLSRKNSGNGHGTGRATDALSPGSLVQSANTGAALSAAVSALLEKTGANGAAVALAERGLLICRVSAGEIAPDVGVALSVNTGITGGCVRSAKILHCRDAQLDDRVDAAVCRKLGIRSILVTPILVDGAVVRIVEALSVSPNAFQPAHVKWLEAVADWLRDIRCCSNQHPPEPVVHQTPAATKPVRIISNEFKRGRKQPARRPAKRQITSKGRHQDPGLDSFRGTLEKIAGASTWEDICHELVRRLEA